jgi:hypothetical protein
MGKIDLAYSWLLRVLYIFAAGVGAWAIVEGWRL